jgi:hypothetical protein
VRTRGKHASDVALESAMDARTKLFNALENVSAREHEEAQADILEAIGLVCDALTALQRMSDESWAREQAAS